MGRFRSEEYAAGWLAGIIDGEGSVMFQRHKESRGHTRVVQIANTDEAIIDATREALDLLGVRYTVQRREYANPKWRPVYQLRIYDRASIERLATKIDLISPPSSAMLRAIAESYTQHRFDREQLHQWFVVERKSHEQIAQMLGCKKWHIQYACEKFGLAISQEEKIRRGWTEERRKRQSATWQMKRLKQRPSS